MSLTFSSGDLIVDRRFDFARMLHEGGDTGAAAALLADTLAEAPGVAEIWAAGWFVLGEWRESLGDTAGAIAAWERALAADPADLLGAGLKRDLARAVPLAEAMPAAFVEALFDQFAPRFDSQLRDKLGYRAPDLLVEELDARGVGAVGRAMDLGCGTGLAGEVLRARCGWLGGCDLSAGMLAQAAARGIYDRLDKADIGALEIGGDPFDLIVAADVFVYVGALERVLGWCAAMLNPGGTLAFTTEAGEAPVALRESRRFAHSEAYLREVLEAAGFDAPILRRAVLRQDRGAPIEGWIVTARRARHATDRQGDAEGFAVA